MAAIDHQIATRLQTDHGALGRSVAAFVRWLEAQTYESYDPYDIWGTKYGLWSRRLYYSKRLLGTPFIAPILLLEILCPQARTLFVAKKRYATADGQLALAFLNLWEVTQDRTFLEKAVALGRDLLASSISGYSGYCWGYPFDWQHSGGCWPKNTPYITVTPYAYEAFAALHDATGESSYVEIIASIARFVHQDLLETPTSPEGAAASYSPLEKDKVVNVSAYRSFVLFDAASRLENEAYAQAARRNLNFVLENQRPDGSWYYEIDGPAKNFIDHFHTCFVLKSLWKLNRRLRSPAVDLAIKKGFAFYQRELFDASGLPKTFAIKPRTQIVCLEMYDFAEAISLGCLLREEIPEAYILAQKLGDLVCRKFQLPDGHFLTRLYAGGFKHSFPYLRWSQAQMFYALTNHLRARRGTLPV